MRQLSTSEKKAFFQNTLICQGVTHDVVGQVADASDTVFFEKDTMVSSLGDSYSDVLYVVKGLLRVSVSSSSGRRITFLLVKENETYNMMSPYMKEPRMMEAQAMDDTTCLRIKPQDFIGLVEKNPALVANLIRMIGGSIDNANSRIIDLMEQKVEHRIMRVLSSLYKKFGTPLHFTSPEISEIAGTTPESALRAMGHLKDRGIVETRRGRINILDPQALEDGDFGYLRI